MKNFLYRLLFKRNDDLDLLQLMFLSCIIFFFVSFGMAGTNYWVIGDRMWDSFDLVFIILAIVGTPKWVAEIVAEVGMRRFSSASNAASLFRGTTTNASTISSVSSPSPKGDSYDDTPVIP
jgi:hypothetical protein